MNAPNADAAISLRQSHPVPQRSPVVAVVGATGAVGQELLTCLAQRSLPAGCLRPLASARSAGQTLRYGDRDLTVAALSSEALEDVDLVYFCTGSDVSRHWVPVALQGRARVVDLSSAFRQDQTVPLVVPEANGAVLTEGTRLVANPNCVAAIAAVALAPLQRCWSITRLSMATYQSASGAGAAGMQELREATEAALAGQAHTPRVMPHPYAFNLFSHNAAVDPETGYNGEEHKVIDELRRILGVARLPIGVTCVRVPVLRAHSIAVTVRFDGHVTPAQVRARLSDAPGLRVVDDRDANHFPMPSEATAQDPVLVGRIRSDLGDPSGRSIALFLCGDQLRKGAALNAVQIAETLLAPA